VAALYTAVVEAGFRAMLAVVLVVKVDEFVTEKFENVAKSFPASSCRAFASLPEVGSAYERVTVVPARAEKVSDMESLESDAVPLLRTSRVEPTMSVMAL
jgi:hypothetical protein